MKPRFAIEATNLADARSTGVGRYTRSLIEALSALQLEDDAEFELVQMFKQSQWRRRDLMAQGPRLTRSSWRGRVWPLRPPDVGLIHIPDERIPPWRVPMVATVPDLYAALHINYTDEAKRQRKLQLYARLRDSCARIVCISEHTRQDFLRHVGGDPDRLRVVGLGVDAVFRPHTRDEIAPVLQRHQLHEPYLFFIGVTANKNLRRVLDAFAAGGAHRTHLLAVAGELPAAERTAIEARVATLGLTGRVRLLGHPCDADLPMLYAGAGALLFPSLYEGFGLPILEAMASGTPVLTSDRGSCPDVAAGHAAIVDPEDVDAMARGIDEALALDAAQRDAARAYAITCTWEQTARQTLAVWQEVLADA